MRKAMISIGAALATAIASGAAADPAREPLAYPAAAVIEFGEWPLEHAEPDAVEAMFRHEIAWANRRFDQDIDFMCFGYSYGEPSADFFERFADVQVPLEGRLACSPSVGKEGFSVLLGLSTIRCGDDNCTAYSDISFGDVIEPGVPITARKVDGVWTVEVER